MIDNRDASCTFYSEYLKNYYHDEDWYRNQFKMKTDSQSFCSHHFARYVHNPNYPHLVDVAAIDGGGMTKTLLPDGNGCKY